MLKAAIWADSGTLPLYFSFRITGTLEEGMDTGNQQAFSGVTELVGQMISHEQFVRMLNRYQWASSFVAGKDVLELACGAGQGLHLLSSKAKSVVGSDVDPSIVCEAQKNNSDIGVSILNFSADNIPYPEDSFDVVVLFEAIYYIPDFLVAAKEISRVLRPGGVLLISSANPLLFDFVKSPYSVRYYSKAELSEVLASEFHHLEFFGFVDVSKVSLRQKLLRPIKAFIAKLNLMPRDMRSKEILKRVFFGKLVSMPTSLEFEMLDYVPPDRLLDYDRGDKHKVIYCVGRKR